MLLDAEQRGDGWFKGTVFDVCICGAGPAGIALARTLASKGHRIALMEAGGIRPSGLSQAFYKGDSIGLPYYPLDACRLRYLGGTSNHWEGMTRPLDVRDFEPLPHHPLNEWPIRKRDLDPYSEQTADILDLSEEEPTLDLFRGTDVQVEPIAFRMSAPTRFGAKYKDELAKSRLISLCVNANLVDIELDPNLRFVSKLVFRSYRREGRFAVKARRFAICCGGLENARILLNANRQMPRGIGNEHDLVGRFFSEHLSVEVGHAIMASPQVRPSVYAASDALISDHRCLSFFVELHPLGRVAPSSCGLPWEKRLGSALSGGPPVCFDADLEIVAGQCVNRDSRVTLSGGKDRFGLRRLVLDWRLTDLDRHTIRTAALEMGRTIARSNVGRMRLAAPLSSPRQELPPIAGQNHHMCTTRMSDDPCMGVVDRNCRVHGIENLYIGGSSVFASCGVANPTYTIVQLALRLGDHLDVQLK